MAFGGLKSLPGHVLCVIVTVVAVTELEAWETGLVAYAIVLLAIVLPTITALPKVVHLLLVQLQQLSLSGLYGSLAGLRVFTAVAMTDCWVAREASLEADTVHLPTSAFRTGASFSLASNTFGHGIELFD